MSLKLTKPERFKAVIQWFEQNMPVAETELHYRTPYELIVAVILSAQCTDKRVNMITPPFFERFPDAATLAESNQEEVFDMIKSCSYPNNKARHLLGMAQMLIREFHGEVPSDIDTLQKLPGVGRKTANVIASVAFDLPALAVDTHVHRVAARIGLSYRAKSPLDTEMQLVKYIPESKLAIAHHWLILHGRYVCIARKPKCNECGLKQWCRYFSTNAKE
ncbi:MAG: endonuclease III [Lentimicrobiaceae bacterium]|nr:endonuclease III [Lentimicrobiaceae bacterium]MCB9024293.1 endonuclease III [Lentimicrobiaceae bacterium]